MRLSCIVTPGYYACFIEPWSPRADRTGHNISRKLLFRTARLRYTKSSFSTSSRLDQFKCVLWFSRISLVDCRPRGVESNAGSVTHLVTSEHPLAIAPALQRLSEDSSSHYKSHPSLNHSPVYNNILPANHTLSKSHSYAENINKAVEEPKVNMAEDLCLDPVILRENHILNNVSERTRYTELKLDNDMTVPEKENSLMSASRLRLLQDTTMIESALDLDSLEDSSVGTNSQAGLMKVMV